jgi:hypothetical protein
MAQLSITLDKYLQGQTTRPAVETRIHRLDAPGRGGAKSLAIMIPAGPRWLSTGQSIDLAPGKYLVEAYLPNGDVATQMVTVREGANEPLHLRAGESPHEWLSWQTFNGYAPSRTPRKTDSTAQPIRMEIVTTNVKLPAALLDVWSGQSPAELPWQRPKGIPPRTDGRQQPEFDRQLNVTEYLYDSGQWNQGDDRCYGLVDHPSLGAPILMVMPMPWRQTAAGGSAEVDVLLESKAGDREWPVRVSLVVRDNIMSSVFGYLSSGDLPAAGRVTDTAINYLFEKVDNPIAAAGGAYILVRLPAGETNARPEWVPWLKNLRTWFSWLPDGAILDGWAHLQGIGRRPDIDKATAAFIEAVDRGLPFYSSGVKLLYEGLTRIKATIRGRPQPKKFAFAFEFARSLALRVDVSQPFTVVRLG